MRRRPANRRAPALHPPPADPNPERTAMLSNPTRDIVKQTIPILRENGEALTRHFYQRMFTHDPQVKAFFNPAHQHAGTQQKALAAAILAYAEHIDDPSALEGAIDLIAHKHVSLGIQPEHYPIVGRHLLGSIQELLGDAATDEILEAWAEAYNRLAEVCIQREAELYREHERRHGWTGFRTFRIDRIVEQSELIRSFHLKPVDGQPLAPFAPGQYLTVRFTTPDGNTTMRNYSLSAAPHPEHYRISVKRELAPHTDAPAGFVSHVLHHEMAEGDEVEVGPPSGNFTLDLDAPTDRPLVLLSGGVGITPLLAMLHTAVAEQPDRSIVFIHGALNSATHAHREEVVEVAANHDNVKVHFRYSDPTDGDLDQGRCHSTGFVDAALIRSLLRGEEGEFYFCGPKPFMVAVNQALDELAVPAAQRHYEFFGPAQELKPATCPVYG